MRLAPAARMASRTAFAFVASQIVERDDVSWPQRRDETLLDIGEEPRAIDRAVKDAWRFDPAAAQRGHKG